MVLLDLPVHSLIPGKEPVAVGAGNSLTPWPGFAALGPAGSGTPSRRGKLGVELGKGRVIDVY